MTVDDRIGFARALGAVGETFNEPVSELRAEAYFNALRDLDVAQVLAAMDATIREARFFPKPVELRERVTGSTEDRAELAWSDVLHNVRSIGAYGRPEFEDDETGDIVISLFGGFRRLCETLPAGGPELLGVGKQFKALFGATVRKYAAVDRDMRLEGIERPALGSGEES